MDIGSKLKGFSGFKVERIEGFKVEKHSYERETFVYDFS